MQIPGRRWVERTVGVNPGWEPAWWEGSSREAVQPQQRRHWARREEKPAELAMRSGSTGSVLSRAIWKRGQTAVQFEPKMRRLVGNYWLPTYSGSGRCPRGGHGNPLQYSCLENYMGRGAWRAAAYQVSRVGHDWVTTTFTFSSHVWTFLISHYLGITKTLH